MFNLFSSCCKDGSRDFQSSLHVGPEVKYYFFKFSIFSLNTEFRAFLFFQYFTYGSEAVNAGYYSKIKTPTWRQKHMGSNSDSAFNYLHIPGHVTSLFSTVSL